MSTFVPSGKNIDRKWYVVDAQGQTLGRLATKAASVLSGKLNPKYVPYIDMGDHVIVINAAKVRLTGQSAPMVQMHIVLPSKADAAVNLDGL